MHRRKIRILIYSLFVVLAVIFNGVQIVLCEGDLKTIDMLIAPKATLIDATTNPEIQKDLCLSILIDAYEYLGEYEDWSHEDRAHWDQFMIEQGYFSAPLINVIPEESDISEAEAIAIAKTAIFYNHTIGSVSFDNCELTTQVRSPEVRYWYITFTDSNYSMIYSISVHAKNGEMLDFTCEEMFDRLIFIPLSLTIESSLTYGLPNERYMPETDAIAVARQALIYAQAIPSDLVERFTPGAWYIVQKEEQQIDLWRIDFSVPSIIGDILGIDFFSILLDAKTGAVVYCQTVENGNG